MDLDASAHASEGEHITWKRLDQNYDEKSEKAWK